MSDPTQGNGVPGTPQGGDAPEYVSKTELNEMMNRAITARFSAFEKKNAETIKGALSSVATDIDTLLTQKLEAFKPTAPGSKPGEAGTPPAHAAVHESPEFKGMAKQLETMRKQVEEQTSRANAEREKARDVALRQKLQDELAKRGVSYTKQALATLVDSEKRVRWSEDGDDSLVFRDSDGADLDLRTGLDGWAKSEDAKIYMAPRNAAGSGDRGGKTPGQKPGAKTATTFEDVGDWVMNSVKTFGG